MTDYLFYVLLSTGAGAVIALLGLGVIVTYQGSGVVNFAHGALAMWPAYVFVELRTDGTYPLPVPGLPDRIDFGGRVQFAPALAIAIVTGTALGLVVYALVFRPLRTAPELAKVVASVGVLVAMLGLVSRRFQEQNVSPAKILPAEPWTLYSDLTVPRDGPWLALLAVVVAGALTGFYRWSRQGLAIRAARENPKGAALLGYSADRLGAISWAMAGTLAALVGILGSPLTQLNPTVLTFTYLIPALGAALVGRFSHIGLTVAAGLAIGAAQSVYTKVQGDLSWLPEIGVREGIPFLVIIVTMVMTGKRLPGRGGDDGGRLPAVPLAVVTPLRVLLPAAVAIAAAVVLDAGWRLALITSVIAAVLALSLVVLTGYVGQTSLAQMTFAGVAGFALARFAGRWDVPFPIAPILAALVACLFGVAVGLPALRVRGVNLALVTLAGGVAITEFVFKNPDYTGASPEVGGATVPSPNLAGLDLGLTRPGDLFRVEFAVLVIVILALLAVAVANLRRGATGRRFLAVRSNERAAAAIGIDPALTKLGAFALSSFIAGIGGALIAYRFGTISDASYGIVASLTVLAFAYLGGITTVSGALVAGAVSSSGLAFYGLDQLSSSAGQWETFIGGVLLVVMAIVYPEGIAGAVIARRRERRSRRALAPA